MRPDRRSMAIEISDIIDTSSERSIEVVLKETGKRAHLPRRVTEFAPGLAIVPFWLYRKIINPANESKV